MKITVLIADDHTIVRQGLRLLLDAQPDLEVVGEAADGNQTIQMAASLEPTLILLDLIMPGTNGIDIIREIKSRKLPSRILVLSSSLESHIITQALQAGADGYVLKASRTIDMLQAIQQVAQGLSALDPAVTHALSERIKTQNPLDSLTLREREVFDLLAQGFSNPIIAERLVVSEATVRTHVTSVLDKLHLRDRTQVMVFALKRGIVRPQDLP